MIRSQINKEIGFLAHGKLKLADDVYRTIVRSIAPESGGFVRNIKDDETANLVLLHLRNLADKKKNPSTREQKKNDAQERFIARLMDHLKWKWSDTSSFMLKIVKKSHTSKCDTTELSKVIRGMISIIDKDIDAGKIRMSDAELKEYRYKTHFHRKQKSEISSQKSDVNSQTKSPVTSPLPLGEGQGEGIERS
ncbi:MAG: hypothetical protein HYV29_01665 [Ignavibacteriales bacterium]|nr:hypothetical protein [Ignavibacteriales bacterium]